MVFTTDLKVEFFITLRASSVRSFGVEAFAPLLMPSNESNFVFVMPRLRAVVFIFAMNDLVRAETVEPVPNLSARAIAASQPDGSIIPYRS
ncbi:hypothetical protein RKD46_004275 [Streptomyces pseudovenezuelae]